MTHLMHLTCLNSPSVWDWHKLSECFDNIVLGFGLNVITISLVSVLAITKRGRRRSKVGIIEKACLLLLPLFGLCLSVFSVIFLVNKALDGNIVRYYEWYFSSSGFAVWMIMLLLSRYANGHIIFCNWLVGGWWIARSVLGGLYLLRTISSLEKEQVLRSLNETFLVLMDIMFGIFVNVTWIKLAFCKKRSCNSVEDPLLPEDIPIEECQEVNCVRGQGCWDYVAFDSISSVMDRGMTKQLEFEDLLELPSDMDPPYCHDKLLICCQAQQTSNLPNPSLLRAICCAYGWPYFRLGFLKILNDCIGFAGPLLLNRLIQFLQQGSGGLDGYILAGSLGITSIIKSFLDTQYSFHLAKLKLKLRSGIMTIIYRKCLCISLAERSQFSEGEIQTFMSVDADRIVNICNSFHDLWSLPLQIGVAFYLLYTQVKFAFISGVAITILLIPVNKWIATLIANATGSMMKQKDERIRRTGELLTHIRTLKMYGWELLFLSWLTETRSLEVKSLATRKYLDAWCVFFWATTPTLFSFFTFGLYALMGHQLDAATVFTCLALFNSLISPLNSFPWVINGLIDAFISSRRLSRFLRCSEQKYNHESTNKSFTFSKNNQSSFIPSDMAIVMHEACCAWSGSNENQQVLSDVNLRLPRSSFITVVGEVGSGKSSLLNALLGEMQVVHGSVSSSGSLSYVPQVPWILSGTVRDNILFGESYHSQRYLDTIQACALDVDISLMVSGDMTYIGDKGINLSGGQRARLALARAIYHGSDIYVLDDVLSAVDSQVASSILNTAILGPLMDKKTRMLCTHNVQAISSADVVVVMDKGHVKWVGNASDLKLSEYSAFTSLNELRTSFQVRNQDCILTTCPSPMEQNDSEGVQEIVEVESRKEGTVELTIYKNYAVFAGCFITVVVCISAILMQASRNGNDLWLSYWVDTTNTSNLMGHSTSFYLLILCLFCLMNSSFTLVRSFSFAFGGLRAAVRVHNTLLNKLIDAPVHFYDKTPRGRILNRLSSDLYTIDDSLPFILNILLANFVGLLGIAIILSYVQVFFLLLLIPFWYIYSKLQCFYRSTSRELRRLDSVSRSPIYTSFTETLDGSSTIRAFSSEEHFFTQFIKHVALYQQTSYSEINASLWLSLRLQLLGALIISFIAILSVLGSQGSLPVSLGTPGLVGLALSYASPIVSLLGSFLSSFTETEKEMVSVERTLEYMDIPQEELHGCESLAPDWPSKGLIEFQRVTMRYIPSLPAALLDITFTIAGGTQVGIVGRTGAGKSSVLNAIFRLHPICGGKILVDSININDVPIRDLRSHLAIVPQSPFLFEGSLRDNLDPFGASIDFKIWSALEKCHMKEEVEAAGGLDTRVTESGTSFSVGQRQLLCLARALLKSSKVLCLDECTASVDTQTASVLQNAISSECKGMTVITIAHRISTVLNVDNILVLDQGMLVEEGNPQALLQDQLSRFSNFAKASTM